MSDYKKIVVNTKNYSVEDMLQGTQPICDTKILEGNEWSFSQDELPATVYYETTSVEVPKVYTFASDTDHVEDRSGRTQEQINRTFYKRMCKEIPSPSGEPITVKNGEEGYVLSAEIKGNTQLFKRAKGSQDEWIVIPNDEGRDTVAFEYKLDSTQAIISNNGEPYPIYANEEDKANKKVISLGGVGDVKDTLEILEDGSGVYTQKTILHIINNFNDSQQATVQDGYLRFGFLVRDIVDAKDGVVLCDKLPNGTLANWNNPTFNCICSGVTGVLNRITMVIKESDIGGSSAQNIDDYFSRNPHTFLFKLGTPIITHIPKELVLSILTHKTNILEVGGKVKASSFKVTVPTTDGIKKEYTLTPINGWKGTAKANLLQTGDIGLVLDLTIPEQFNTLITNLPNELKPKTERTVLGYNGNTPVVVKIGTDGTVKLPVTTTGVVKLDDTYKL